MSQLPIQAVLPELLKKLQLESQLILKAPPGAGKSTLLPLEILKQKWLSGKIVMLEPRRLAARNIARYLASQLNENVGETIGYRVRGESKTSASTRLEIVTEGIMTRMIQSAPELSGVELLIFDEFHERSIHADVSLAFSLEVQQVFRDDLKLLIMSATLDQSALQRLLPEAAYVESQGRHYPIEYRYAPLRVNERMDQMISRQIRTLLDSESGSILVFLPGMAAIKQVQNKLNIAMDNVDVLPLYGQLDFSQQQKAISPSKSGRRKVVLATNIAETSLTIDGIRVVIDSGIERLAKFDLKSGITRLEEGRIAQSSAEQRAGRAGRLEEGVCLRMYSKEQLALQPQVPQAEILHSDLSSLCMELSQWGVTSVEELSWLDIPSINAINQGYELLTKLGLVTDSRQLTEWGKEQSQLGTDVRLAAMLLKAKQNGTAMLSCALCLVALIEESRHSGVDIASEVYAIKNHRHNKQSLIAKRVAILAKRMAVTVNLKEIDDTLIGLCLAVAYPDRIGQNRNNRSGKFILANGHGATISSDDPLSDSQYIVAIDLMRTRDRESQIFLAAKLDIACLTESLPYLVEESESVEWDVAKGRLIAETRQCIGNLVISRKALPQPAQAQLTQALLNYIHRSGLQCLPWDKQSQALLERYRCGAEWFPEKEWPNLSAEALLTQLDAWLEPFMNNMKSVKSLQSIDLSAALTAYLGWPLNQQVDELLPIEYQLPTGSKKRIRYQSGKEPMLSVRMQEVFGEKVSPAIANGRKTIVLELLSPAQRPLQITADLAGFWQGAYKEVQKEMKGRYPKHLWPDDPANHIATTKTKRQLKI
ncbi:ATP-dependent helicase HrpB [Vibrio sp. 99-8-1]|uniref:ATP-dependent helicase HrpB n=1 Tax=Vibrio sp. 99-8-1 TaxID=2607602 RepID=UPI0014934C79|nr:ATP-dependent helicase HrpB [Vibrio sp. 99-8-1]